jgi:hypothetical protein
VSEEQKKKKSMKKKKKKGKKRFFCFALQTHAARIQTGWRVGACEGWRAGRRKNSTLTFAISAFLAGEAIGEWFRLVSEIGRATQKAFSKRNNNKKRKKL